MYELVRASNDANGTGIAGTLVSRRPRAGPRHDTKVMTPRTRSWHDEGALAENANAFQRRIPWRETCFKAGRDPADERRTEMKRAGLNVVGCLVIGLCQLVGAGSAFANSPGPCWDQPLLSVEAIAGTNTVHIMASDLACDEQDVPEGVVIVRQNVDSGEEMEIPVLCSTDQASSEDADFVDECVPAGTYRYGIATYEQCWDFPEVTLAETDAECVRTNPEGVPVAFEGEFDWSYTPPEDDSGCSMTSSPAQVVFPAYVIAALAALGVVLRRRAHKK